MIKLSNAQIEAVVIYLRSLQNEKLGIKLNFKIAKLLTSLTAHLTDYNTSYGEIVREHAKKDKDGGYVFADGEGTSVEIEDVATFEKELIELRQIQIDYHPQVFLVMDDFIDSQKEFTLEEILLLEPFIPTPDAK